MQRFFLKKYKHLCLFCHNVSNVHTFKRKSMCGISLLVLFDIRFKGQIYITGGLNESIGN